MAPSKRTLTLAVKAVYFHDIKEGRKPEEFRLVNAYWTKRIVGQDYDTVVMTLGYPRADDHERRLVLPWKGYRIIEITHPHFGNQSVEVFAIDVTG